MPVGAGWTDKVRFVYMIGNTRLKNNMELLLTIKLAVFSRMPKESVPEISSVLW